MVFKAAFNNISVISLRLHLLVEETEYPEKTTNLLQVTEKLYHIYTVVPSRSRLSGVRTHNVSDDRH